MLEEVYKSINHIGPQLGWNSFELVDTKCNIRFGHRIKLPLAKNTVCINSFDFRAGSAWNHLPNKIKLLETLNRFTCEIKKLRKYYSCKLCNVFEIFSNIFVVFLYFHNYTYSWPKLVFIFKNYLC